MQCFVREAIRCGAAAHIGMDTGEPGLFELPCPTIRPLPHVRSERLASLVNGHRVIRALNGGIQLDVVVTILALIEQLAQETRGAECPPRSPNPHEPDRRPRY